MKQRLIDILNKYGYPVMLQGSLNPEEESFWKKLVSYGGVYLLNISHLLEI